MAGFVIKAVLGLVVVGAIWFFGFVAGGAFATGMAEESVLQHVARCLPAETIDQLRPCLAQGG
ncbi:hypothetical protein [Nostocoides vanveenii]|uniref:Uncharacterized protein n=1 Tax=Nostocoides vanveenii TaxID=330835 RepID=A0ABN2KXW9_9MICO